MDAYTGLNIADQDSLVQCLKKRSRMSRFMDTGNAVFSAISCSLSPLE